MYVKINNQGVEKYPYSIGELRKDNSQVSFPKTPSLELLKSYNVFPVIDTGMPPHTISNEIAYKNGCVFVDGNWKVNWIVRQRTQEEVLAYLSELKQEIVSQVQQRLDNFAKTKGYDSILSACTYANSSTSEFAEEGKYCVSIRDNIWLKLYEILAEVEAGTRPIPQTYADIEPELPVLSWPV